MAVASRFAGFGPEDFAVFAIEDFAPRMEALRGRLRPKLVDLAEELSPRIGASLGITLYPHVAAHMRRTVNPPPETWAAFGPEPRRYKAFAHYALGIDIGGVWLRLVLKDEAAEDRKALGRLLEADPRLGDDLPADMEIRTEKETRPVRTAPSEAETARLLRRADAGWAAGRRIAAQDPRLESAAGVAAAALETFAALAPLWRRLPSSPWKA